MNDQTKNLANVGVGVDVKLSPMSAVYILGAFVLGTICFFVAKKYIR